MAKLVINRKNGWFGRFRNYAIYLDGRKIGEISNNQTKEFEIDLGEHSVKGKIDWVESKEERFSIAGNETKLLNLTTYKYEREITFFTGFVGVLYLILKYMLAISSLLLFIPVMLCALVNVYYLTFGKNQFLRFVSK